MKYVRIHCFQKIYVENNTVKELPSLTKWPNVEKFKDGLV